MAKQNLLTDRLIKETSCPSFRDFVYLNDGAGLRLRIRANGTKTWIHRWKVNGTEYSIAFVHFVVRLLNYPVCGRFCNVVFLNKISSLVFIFNIINLFVWIIFSRDVNNVFLFMSISLVLHLVILIILIIKNKYKHYLSIPN